MRAGDIAGVVKNKGYRVVCIDGERYLAHRVAFALMGKPVPQEVDHKNRVRDDNRWCNLRASTRQGNMVNRRHWSRSGVKNVRSKGGMFEVRYRRDGVLHYVGLFKTLKDAVVARDAAIEAAA